jgi:hypothetical protein
MILKFGLLTFTSRSKGRLNSTIAIKTGLPAWNCWICFVFYKTRALTVLSDPWFPCIRARQRFSSTPSSKRRGLPSSRSYSWFGSVFWKAGEKLKGEQSAVSGGQPI